MRKMTASSLPSLGKRAAAAACGISLLATACQKAPEASTTQAIQGLPDVNAGVLLGDTLNFFAMEAGKPVIDPSTKQPKIRHSVKVRWNGSTVDVLADDGVSRIGKTLVTNPAVTFSFLSNDLWTCDDAERFVGRTAPATPLDVPGTSECYVEINTTGDSGFAVSIIGLPGGQGMKAFVNRNKPALVAGEERGIKDSPASLRPRQRVNALIDKDFALKAMRDIAAEFRQDVSPASMERNTCLKNQRAFGWLDIQAHYYCQIPLNPYRDCYARKLIEVNEKVLAGAFDASTLNGTRCAAKDASQVNPFCVAFDACLQDTPYFKTHANAAEHVAQFSYLMFNRAGALDFNIESENEVINAFYGVTDADPTSPTFDGDKRPRRLLDTYPYWLPDQPRYNKVRLLQQDMQKKLGLDPGQ